MVRPERNGFVERRERPAFVEASADEG